jgi:hypothetical protein
MMLSVRRLARHNATNSAAVSTLTPMRIATSLAAVFLGTVLLWDHPGTTAVAILAWPRLLLTAAPFALVLLAIERRLSRRLRAREFSPYPLLFPVLLVLFGLSVVVTGAVNGLLPSARRVVRARPVRVMNVVWEAMTPVGNRIPGIEPSTDEEGIVVVHDWRAPGTELQLTLPAAEIARAWSMPEADLEIVEAGGFLGVPIVASARFVAP